MATFEHAGSLEAPRTLPSARARSSFPASAGTTTCAHVSATATCANRQNQYVPAGTRPGCLHTTLRGPSCTTRRTPGCAAAPRSAPTGSEPPRAVAGSSGLTTGRLTAPLNRPIQAQLRVTFSNWNPAGFGSELSVGESPKATRGGSGEPHWFLAQAQVLAPGEADVRARPFPSHGRGTTAGPCSS